MTIVHSLYCGVTNSGKTTLARYVCRGLIKKKRPRVVFDPMGTNTAGGDWGEGATIYSDVDSFLDLMYSDGFGDTDVFVDEAHNIFSHDKKEHLWMLTQGRHYGMRFHLLTQRPPKVHPDARTNCGQCFMFRLAFDDVKAIGNDYGYSDIHKINLDRGDFLILNSGSAKFSRANVFNLVK